MPWRAIGSAFAVATLSGASMAALAAPAAAYVCSFNVERPSSGSILGTATANVAGVFVVKQGTDRPRVIEVAFTKAPGALPATVTRSGAAVGPADQYDVAVGPLALNGRYSVRVKASHAGTGLLNCDDALLTNLNRDGQRSGDMSFGVSVQAKPPVNVAARLDVAARTAMVTWDKSTDPDIAGYTVSKKVGTAAPTKVDLRPEPRSWTDENLPTGGGTVVYSVQASRNGPDPGTTSEPSGAVTPAAIEVPPPAPSSTTSTTVPPTVTTPPGTPPPTTGGTPPPVNGPQPTTPTTPTTAPFVLGRPVGAGPSPAGTAPALRLPTGLNVPSTVLATPPLDGGSFQPLLPYPSPTDPSPTDPPPTDPPTSEIPEQALAAGDRAPQQDTGTPQLAYVAAALLSAVIAAYVLWLRRQSLVPQSPGMTTAYLPLEPLEAAEPVAPPFSVKPTVRVLPVVPTAPPSPPPEPLDPGPPPLPLLIVKPGGPRRR